MAEDTGKKTLLARASMEGDSDKLAVGRTARLRVQLITPGAEWWGESTVLDLAVVVSGSGFKLTNGIHKVTLTKTADTEKVFCDFTPRRSGKEMLRLSIYIWRNFDLLEEYEIPFDVAENETARAWVDGPLQVGKPATIKVQLIAPKDQAEPKDDVWVSLSSATMEFTPAWHGVFLRKEFDSKPVLFKVVPSQSGEYEVTLRVARQTTGLSQMIPIGEIGFRLQVAEK